MKQTSLQAGQKEGVPDTLLPPGKILEQVGLESEASSTNCSFSWPWVTVLFRVWIVKVLVAQSCPTLCHPLDCSLPGSSVHGILQDSLGTGVGCHFFLQIFPTQGLNPGLLHCRQILYCLSHSGWLQCRRPVFSP